MKPCPLPLVALRGDETCPRCGRPAREHRGHPSYQEMTMTETTEPTREQIEGRIAYLESLVSLPEHAVGWEMDLAVFRMALRTLDAEAQLAAMTERAELAETLLGASNAAVDALRATTSAIGADLRAIRDAAMTHAGEFMHAGETAAPAIERMATALREATERAELAERERDAMRALHVDTEADLRMRIAEAELERDEALALARVDLAEQRRQDAESLRDRLARMHRRAQRAESATADARREAIGQRMRADWWRREAKRLGWTPDYPELREEPTSDARIDCESSSLLLLSTWARRVMMRPKNRAKGVPSESIRTLLWMARDELFEAYSAIEENAPTDDILAELGDAAAIIGFAMREIEKRRNA